MPAETWSLQETPKLNEEQFTLWQTLLEDRTGMQITEQRKSFLETSLTLRMREIGLANYDTYYEKLMSGLAGEIEWSTLVDRLTVQETSFFRHQSSFKLVRDYVQALFARQPERKQVDVWSVGCSTGEEPYALAMLLDELISGMQGGRYFGVTATDLSLPALAKAREGLYNARKVAMVPEPYRDRYFTPAASERYQESGRYQVVPALKERVCFARLNVLDLGDAPMRNMDVIFCQNLLIYFRRWRKKDIVNHLAERLAPGGLLVIGVGELLDWSHPQIERYPYDNTLAFMRIDSARRKSE